MQPFTCKLKAENISRSDDPSIRMILALGKDHSILHERRMILVLGSSSFHVNGALVFTLAARAAIKLSTIQGSSNTVFRQQSSRSAEHARALYLISPCT